MTNVENKNPKRDYVLLNISPCSLREANEFVSKFHRHHKPTVGHKFSKRVFKTIWCMRKNCKEHGLQKNNYIYSGI